MLRPINPPAGPTSPAYSEAIEATGTYRFLFVSGQVGVAADGSVPAAVADQVKIAIGKVNVLLAEAGMTTANIVKYTIYLTDAGLIPNFVAAADGSLPQPPPAATLLIVKSLAHPALLVEIEAMAVA